MLPPNTRPSRNSMLSCGCAPDLGRERGHAGADIARRDLRRHAVDVGAGGGRGRRGVRHFGSVGRGDAHPVERHAEFFRHHLRDLGEQALPHLGAAVVQMDGAVGIDMHQRAGLIEMDERERDAEHHGRQRDAALEDRALGVELGDFLATRAIVAGGFQLGDHRGQRVEILDDLVVGRHRAAGAIEIRLAHVERIEAALARDAVDHPLDRDHALRAAEAAIGGVGDGVGLQPARGDPGRRQPVAIGGMEHRAVDDAEREVGRTAAARVEHHVIDGDHAALVVADAPVGAEIVALAGHGEIVVAVEPDLARPPGDARRHRGDRRPLAGLALLAAEAAAHAARLDGDERVGNAEDARRRYAATSVGSCVETCMCISPASPGMASEAWPSR